MTGLCHFCSRHDSEIRVHANESENVKDDVFVCEGCWGLLKRPETALPLIRGDLSIALKGKIPEPRLNEAMNKFMEKLSKLKQKD